MRLGGDFESHYGVPLRMAAAGIRLGDILDDSGYAHRTAAWAIPLRQAGAQLTTLTHPSGFSPTPR